MGIIFGIKSELQMENRKVREKERSQDLPFMLQTQQQDSFVSDLRAHLIHEKYRVLKQKLHPSSKVNHFRPSFAKPTLKHSPYLIKHNNKVEANIELHRSGKTNRFVRLPNKKSLLRKCTLLHQDAYFTPKTREQIESRHMKTGDSANREHKLQNKSLNFIRKMVRVGTSNKQKMRGRIWGDQSDCSPVFSKGEKQNLMKHTITPLETAEASSFQCKYNTLCAISHSPSRIYCKEKQQLVSLDEKVTKKGTQISGFNRHQLFSYYKSLIYFSHTSEQRYLTGFETMLNLMNIPTNQSTVRQLLLPFMVKPSFQLFIQVFQRILQSSLRQSVVDFFEIVLDGKRTRWLNFEELVVLLAERMSQQHAKQIVEEVYFQLDKDNEDGVNVQQMVALCYRSQEFCGFMRGYCQETQRQRVSLKPQKG